jgi:hypothetical protein
MAALDLSGIGTYSVADKLLAVDHAIMTVMLGGESYGVNGRLLTRADLNKLREFRDELVMQQNIAANGVNGANVLARFGETS